MSSSKLSRRAFLQRAAGIAVGVTVLESALAACTAPVAAPAGEAGSAPAAEPVTLVVETYQWDEAGFKDWMDWINEQLIAQSPNVTVEKRSAPYTEYWDKILVKAQAGTLGDVFQLSANYIDQWFAMDQLAPMNDYIDVEEAQTLMNEGISQRIVIDGQMMGVPTLHTTNQVMIYNMKHFEDAGVSVRGQGEQDAWLQDAVALTDAPDRYGVVVHTVATNQLNEDMSKFVNAWGAQYSSEDGTPTCDTPEMVGAVDFYRQVVESGATPIGTEKTIYRPMTWNGKISQLLDGSWVFGMAANSGAEALEELSAAPLPYPNQRGNLIFNLYNLYAQSKVPDVGAEWLSIAWSEDGSKQFAEKTGSPHARFVEYPEELLGRMPWLPAYQQVMNTEPVVHNNPGFALVLGEADDIIRRWGDQAILARSVSPEEACAGMQAEMEELSKKYDGETF